MRLIIASILALSLLTGCADNKVLNGVEYQTYGLVDKDHIEDKCVNYDLSWGNIVWSVILSETLIMPAYFVGFSLYEPVSLKKDCE